MKLVFLDIDGTLTPPGSNVPPQSALDAIARARANGHKVFLCTGRNLDMLKPVLQYGLTAWWPPAAAMSPSEMRSSTTAP